MFSLTHPNTPNLQTQQVREAVVHHTNHHPPTYTSKQNKHKKHTCLNEH